MKQMVGMKDVLGVDCELCGKRINKKEMISSHMGDYCVPCFYKERTRLLSSIIITSTHNIDGYKVEQYLGFDSVEIVIGTGLFSELTGEVSDFLGTRSIEFEKKLSKAKISAQEILKFKAVKKGGNAIVGVDLNYTEFSGNRVGLIMSGTIVFIKPIE